MRIFARCAATFAAVKLAFTDESSLQKSFHHVGDSSQSCTQVWTTEAKLKSLPPIETPTWRMLCVAA